MYDILIKPTVTARRQRRVCHVRKIDIRFSRRNPRCSLALIVHRFLFGVDDETWLGQLRAVRVGKERTETDLEEGSQRQHLRGLQHGRDHRRRTRHALRHGSSRGVQARTRLDRRESGLRHREYRLQFVFAWFFLPARPDMPRKDNRHHIRNIFSSLLPRALRKREEWSRDLICAN